MTVHIIAQRLMLSDIRNLVKEDRPAGFYIWNVYQDYKSAKEELDKLNADGKERYTLWSRDVL